jgi:hypothetical protein
MASFPTLSSMPLRLCPLCSLSLYFSHHVQAPRPVLHDVTHQIRDALFHTLVAQFVGVEEGSRCC